MRNFINLKKQIYKNSTIKCSADPTLLRAGHNRCEGALMIGSDPWTKGLFARPSMALPIIYRPN